MMNLKAQLKATLAMANVLITKHADGTAWTEPEVTQLKGYTDEARDLKAKIEAAEKGAEIMGAFQNGPNEGTQVRGGQPVLAGAGAGVKGRLDLSGFAANTIAGMKQHSAQLLPGRKGVIATGDILVPVPIVGGDPIPGAAGLEVPPRLIDYLPFVQRPSAVYKFRKQQPVADPGGAGVVAKGDVKPTLKMQWVTVESRLRVLAVLSEPIDEMDLEDVNVLASWVTNELSESVRTALETEVLTGDGTGEHFTGLANTSGIQTQAYSTDRITTIAAGQARLTNLGIAPTVVALSAADALAIQTARNASGNFDLGGPIGPAGSKPWGVPFVTVPGLAAGDAYVIGAQSVEVSTDGRGLRVKWGQSDDMFDRNEVKARVEGRFNLDVNRPHGIVRLDLSA